MKTNIKTNMKTVMKFMSVIVLFSGLISMQVQAAESTVFTVNGMVCAFCAQGIEKKLNKMPETAAVYIDLAKKTVAVEAKEGMQIKANVVSAEIKDAGYDVIKTETLAQSVAQIKSALEKRHE